MLGTEWGEQTFCRMDQQWCLTAPPWVRVRVARIQGETREFHGECTAVYKMRGGWWGREGSWGGHSLRAGLAPGLWPAGADPGELLGPSSAEPCPVLPLEPLGRVLGPSTPGRFRLAPDCAERAEAPGHRGGA